MSPNIKKIPRFILQHRYGYTLFAFLVAAAITGAGCVLFMRGFEFILRNSLDLSRVGLWCWLITPALFLASVELVQRAAPFAGGAGIPQVIFAAKHLTSATEAKLSPLFSPLTLVVKVAALFLSLWVGASTGPEAPAVHVATCLFVGVLLMLRRWGRVQFDMRSAVVAGGAAGLAAVFNTPLAGVVFAVEELTSDYFSGMKDYVIMAIIVAAIAAKSLAGEFEYFGKLLEPSSLPLLATALIGLLGGVLGAFFSTAFIRGMAAVNSFRHGAGRFLIPVSFAWGLLALAAVAGASMLGPGNEAAQELIHGNYRSWAVYFPFAKMAATLLTSWSGIPGGIFAPCLSIGAALGANVAALLQTSVAGCALVGMAAFLSGSIQAPMTSFVIIFEMTGHHQMLVPIMLASLISFMVARVLNAPHFYQALASSYEFLLDPQTNREYFAADSRIEE